MFSLSQLTFTEKLWSFWLFMFYPTLIYRTHYPVIKRRRRWMSIFKESLNFLACILFVYVVFYRFSIPENEKTVSHPGNLSIFVASIFNSTIPGMMILMLGFFGVMHSFQNLFAELFRFGDRHFYDDWWNCKSWSSYYRKSNVIVYEWLHNYLYLPMLELGYSHSFAELLMFVFSFFYNASKMQVPYNPIGQYIFSQVQYLHWTIKNRKMPQPFLD